MKERLTLMNIDPHEDQVIKICPHEVNQYKLSTSLETIKDDHYSSSQSGNVRTYCFSIAASFRLARIMLHICLSPQI